MLDIRPEIAEAILARRAVVALESSLIAQGLPWPANLETALAAEQAVREAGATPATIGVWQGRPTVGLAHAEMEALARGGNATKAGSRDLAAAVARGHTAATTVSATVLLAFRSGIRFVATGGIGGVHRGASSCWDVSTDLVEISRTPVAVVCAGAKIILDIPLTLQALETLGVPVVGFQTDEFPAFYLRSSGLPVSARVEGVQEARTLIAAHWELGGRGLVIAQPPETDLPADQLEAIIKKAEAEAAERRIRGGGLTPFLLGRLAEATGGKTVQLNRELVVANARLAARFAVDYWRHWSEHGGRC